MILAVGVLPTKDSKTTRYMGDVRRSTISKSFTQAFKRQRTIDVGSNNGAMDDILDDNEMENIYASQPSLQELFENEVRTRI